MYLLYMVKYLHTILKKDSDKMSRSIILSASCLQKWGDPEKEKQRLVITSKRNVCWALFTDFQFNKIPMTYSVNQTGQFTTSADKVSAGFSTLLHYPLDNLFSRFISPFYPLVTKEHEILKFLKVPSEAYYLITTPNFVQIFSLTKYQ